MLIIPRISFQQAAKVPFNYEQLKFQNLFELHYSKGRNNVCFTKLLHKL